MFNICLAIYRGMFGVDVGAEAQRWSGDRDGSGEGEQEKRDASDAAMTSLARKKV